MGTDWILPRAKELSSEIIADRRRLHEHPETGMELPATSAYVMEKLTALGYEPHKIGGDSVFAKAGGKRPGRTFLCRADMDALPLSELTGLPYASKNPGRMHACGHDCHTAMLLGAAKMLKEREEEIPGTVVLFFQAAEETLQGAKAAVDDGLLDRTRPDAGMMIHVASAVDAPDGTLAAPDDGACYASADWYEVHVTGKGGHGASPHLTVSAINMITAVNAGIQELVSVGVPASETAVMTVGQIHAGDTSNIIPETAFLAGTIRTFSEDVRKKIREDLETLVRGVTASRGGTGEVRTINSTPAVVNDPEVCRCLLRHIAETLGQDKAARASELPGLHGRESGSEDFSHIAGKIPCGIFWLMAGRKEDGYIHPVHNPRCDFRESALWCGAAAYTASAFGWLADHPA